MLEKIEGEKKKEPSKVQLKKLLDRLTGVNEEKKVVFAYLKTKKMIGVKANIECGNMNPMLL